MMEGWKNDKPDGEVQGQVRKSSPSFFNQMEIKEVIALRERKWNQFTETALKLTRDPAACVSVCEKVKMRKKDSVVT